MLVTKTMGAMHGLGSVDVCLDLAVAAALGGQAGRGGERVVVSTLVNVPSALTQLTLARNAPAGLLPARERRRGP